MTKSKKILAIVGPTASGKSGVAVLLAKKLNGEVISADSRQVYKGLDIGTGKITKKEMKGVRHHLLDVADPRRTFTAEKYRILAQKAIDDVLSRGKLPIVCGGSGFYIDAALSSQPFPDAPPNARLRAKLKDKAAPELMKILRKLDKARAAFLSKSDSERSNRVHIIRAIEVATALGKHPKRGNAEPLYDVSFVGIKISPEELKKNIKKRLMKRIKQGMVLEAIKLHAKGLSWKRMDELGLEYRYMARYLRGELSKEDFLDKLETEIWHYTKRQMTWWKRNKKIRWIDKKKAMQLGVASRF